MFPQFYLVLEMYRLFLFRGGRDVFYPGLIPGVRSFFGRGLFFLLGGFGVPTAVGV